MKTTKFLLLLAAVALLIVPAGCIFSPDDGDEGGGGTPTPPPIPLAGTEEQLMANFRTAYEDMDYNTFEDLLHPDFITILQNSTVEEFPDVGLTLDLAEELRIHQRMFSGQPVTDPDGALVQAISSISFNIFEQQGTWATSQPNDVIPNARFALYDVTFLFDRPGASTLKVDGQIKFYVTGRDSVVSGLTKTYWQMIGQQDLTNSGKSVVAGM
jgi:hypothetical protein